MRRFPNAFAVRWHPIGALFTIPLLALFLLGLSEGPAREIELVKDRTFHRGFEVLLTSTRSVSGVLKAPTAVDDARPAWKLAQWYSNGEIRSEAQGTFCSAKNLQGHWCWSNPYKTIALGGSSLSLSIDAKAEWKNSYRKTSDPYFPHLLIEQDLTDRVSKAPSLGKIKALNLSLLISLGDYKFPERDRADYDRSRHAVQFNMYLTIQNRRSKTSVGYGDFFWLGLPIFDDRFDMIGSGAHVDPHSQKLVWSINQREFMAASITAKPDQKIRYDVLPQIKTALHFANEKGLMASEDLEDYYVSSINMGYEMPGMGRMEFRVQDVSLLAQCLAACGAHF